MGDKTEKTILIVVVFVLSQCNNMKSEDRKDEDKEICKSYAKLEMPLDQEQTTHFKTNFNIKPHNSLEMYVILTFTQ